MYTDASAVKLSTPAAVSGRGGDTAAARALEAPETALRNSVLERWGTIRATARWHRMRVHLKQAVWAAAADGTEVLKRPIDIFGALVLLMVLAPLFGLIAILIKLDSPGPILFKQIRVGKWGRCFEMYKFRSMHLDAERRFNELKSANEIEGGVLFKMRNDPRITGFGRFIRRGSLDEIPQLWNVLAGEMSLVGPRPPLPSEVELYTLAERRRLDATPGITGLWQVSGRSEIPFHQQVELDVAYIESQSLRGDLKILLKTIPAVLLGRGAY